MSKSNIAYNQKQGNISNIWNILKIEELDNNNTVNYNKEEKKSEKLVKYNWADEIIHCRNNEFDLPPIPQSWNKVNN